MILISYVFYAIRVHYDSLTWHERFTNITGDRVLKSLACRKLETVVHAQYEIMSLNILKDSKIMWQCFEQNLHM